MGWMHTYKPAGQSMADFFVAQGVLRFVLPEGVDHIKYRVLDTSTVARKSFYAAVERVDTRSGKREVFALIVLLRWTAGNYNLLYKDMDETMNPYEAECPERILALLTPTNDENANEWRARCRKLHARRREVKHLRPGTVLEYGRHSYRLIKSLGRQGWEAQDTLSGAIYRMTGAQLIKAVIAKGAA